MFTSQRSRVRVPTSPPIKIPPIRVVFLLIYWKGLEPGAVVNEAPVEPQSGTLSEAAAECESPYIPTPLSPQARIESLHSVTQTIPLLSPYATQIRCAGDRYRGIVRSLRKPTPVPSPGCGSRNCAWRFPGNRSEHIRSADPGWPGYRCSQGSPPHSICTPCRGLLRPLTAYQPLGQAVLSPCPTTVLYD